MRSSLRRWLALTVVAVVTALAGLHAQQPADKVFVTKTGTKYHRASCSSLSKSKIEMTLAEAAARYSPCKICKPPVLATLGSVASSPSPNATAERSASVEAGRCQATTKKGTQCSRRARPGSKFCWQHGG